VIPTGENEESLTILGHTEVRRVQQVCRRTVLSSAKGTKNIVKEADPIHSPEAWNIFKNDNRCIQLIC